MVISLSEKLSLFNLRNIFNCILEGVKTTILWLGWDVCYVFLQKFTIHTVHGNSYSKSSYEHWEKAHELPWIWIWISINMNIDIVSFHDNEHVYEMNFKGNEYLYEYESKAQALYGYE